MIFWFNWIDVCEKFYGLYNNKKKLIPEIIIANDSPYYLL